MAKKWKKKEIEDYISTKQISQENYVAPTVEIGTTPSYKSVASTVDAFNSVQPTIKSVDSTIDDNNKFSFSIDNKKEEPTTGQKLGFVGKSAGAGLVSGLTGIADAPLQNVQEGAQKGKKKGKLENYLQGLARTLDIYGLSTMPETAKEVQQIAQDKNKKGWQKALNIGGAILNNNPLVNNLEAAGQQLNIVDKNADKNIKKTREIVETPSNKLNESVAKDSEKMSGGWKIAGEVSQTIGNMIPSMALSAVTKNPDIGLAAMGVSAKGQATKEAEERGADLNTANEIGLGKGLVEVGTEKLTGGLKFFGKGTADDIVEKGINKAIKNKAGNFIAKQAAGMAGEVGEETISDLVGTAIDKATVDPDASYSFDDWKKTALMTMLSTGALNTISGGYGRKAYQLNAEELNDIAQSKKVQDTVNERVENFKTPDMTPEQVEQLREQTTAVVLGEIQQNVDDILDSSIAQLQEQPQIPTQTPINTLSSNIQEQNNQILGQQQTPQITPLNQVNQELQEIRQNDIANQVQAMNLQQEPEFTQKQGNYVYEKSNNSKIDTFRKDAATYLKEGEQTDNFVKTLEKIIEDKDIEIRFDPNLRDSQGRMANGSYSNNVITLNPNSNRAGEFVAIHELTHAIGTKPMIDMIQTYRKSNAEFNNAVERLLSTYNTTEINEEALGDIAGQLFGNQEYINNLSMENPSLFKKIYNEIKYLWHQFTGYKNQDQFIEDLRNKWESAYRNQKVQQKAKNSNIEMSNQTDSNGNMLSNEQVDYFKDSKVRDENGNLIPVYHGTNYDFTIFKNPSRKFNEYASGKMFENTSISMFTDSQEVAQTYVDNEENPNRKPMNLYLNITNPYIVDADYQKNTYFFDNDGTPTNVNNLVKKIYDSGKYDGVIIKNIADLGNYEDYDVTDGRQYATDYIAFNSNQIKNIDNLTPTQDDDIRYSKNEELDNSSFSLQKKYDDIVKQRDKLKEESSKLYDKRKKITDKISNYSMFKQYEETTNIDKLLDENKQKSLELYEEQKQLEKQLKEVKQQEKQKKIDEVNKRTTPFKDKQFKIIQKSNPMLDDYHTGIRQPGEIRTWTEAMYDAEQSGEGFSWGDFSKEDGEKALKNNSIKIYSSYPIKNGVFVSTSFDQAKHYAGGDGSKVYSKTINPDKVAWINVDEGQYADAGINTYEAKYSKDTKGWTDYVSNTFTKDNTGRELSDVDNYVNNNNFSFKQNGSLEINNLSNKQIKTLLNLYKTTGYEDVSTDYLSERLKQGNMVIPREVADRFIEKELGYKPQIDKTKVFEDSEGRKLTKEQVEFYKDSDVRDIRGRLIPVFHRTNADFTVFDTKAGKQHGAKYGKGLYFSITPENYGNRTIEAYLNAKEGDYKYIPNMGYYIVQNSNQIKNVDNLNPTEDPDIRYSKDNQTWREYLEKEFPSQGTRTNLQDINERNKPKQENKTSQEEKPQEMPKNEVKQEVKKNYLTSAEQNELDGLKSVENSGFAELTKQEQARMEELEKKSQGITKKFPELSKTVTQEDTKPLYFKYKDSEISKENNKILNEAKKIVESNKQGRRTKEQWLQVAEYIGSNADIKNSTDLQKLAMETWLASRPNTKDNLNRQGKKYVDFKTNEWFNAMYKGAGVGTEAKLSQEEKNTINESKQENKTTQEEKPQEMPKNPVADSVKAMNLEKENIKYSAEEKIEKSVRNQYKSLSEDKIQKIIDLKIKQEQKNQLFSNFNNKTRAKQREMINAYETNAEIRKIVQGDSLQKVEGGLTDTELAKAIEKENSNYIGKKVIVDGQNGTVIGNPYGRVKVEFENGTTKTFDRDEVKSMNETKKDKIVEAKDTKGNKVDLKPTGNKTYERVNVKPTKNQVIPDMSNKVLNIGDEKLSNFYSNITEKSKFITEENRTKLMDNDNLKYYDAITNKDTLQNAMKNLDTNTEQQVGEFFTKKEFTPEDVATGWILVKRYQDAGNFDAMSNVIEKMREQGTKAGQTVQMYGILQRLTPEGMEYYSQKQLDNAFNKFSENKSKKQIEKYAKDFTLTAEEHQFIKDTMEKVGKMTNEDAKKVEVAKIVSMLSDKLPPEKGQRLKAWMRISMLGNPKTQVRNVMGNAIIQPVNWVGDVFSATADKIISKKTGIRTKGQTDFGALTGGFIKGGKEAIRDAKTGVDTRDINLDRFEENIGAKPFYEGHKSKVLNLGAKALNKTNKILGNVMSGGDRIFYQAIYENSLKNQMKLNKVTTPTQEMIDIATNEALSRTWNDSNEYTKAVLQIRSALNKLNVKGYGLGDVLIPFAKTPANLTKAIVDYSPVGLTRSILQDGKNLKNSLENGQYNAKLQHKFADSLGKGVAGTMLYIAAYSLAKAGITTGASDDDKDVANFMRNTLGIQPYSVKIGDKSFTYDWAQPIAAPFAITADYKRITEKENQDLSSALKSAVSSGSNILLEQSFLSSIQDVFNNYNGPTEAIMDQIKGLPARATPTFFKQIADMVDPTKRQTFEKGQSLGENIKNQVIAKLPEASKSLESQKDTLGREIEKYGGNEDKIKYAFNVFLNPANTQKGKPSEAAEEIYEVYKATGDKTIMPRQVGYSENIGGTWKNLTSKERNEWQKLSGEKIEENVSALTSNSKYNAMSDEDKAAVINGIVNYSYAKAKSDLFGTNISTMYRTAAKKEEQGIPLYDYYIERISKRR